ncbi:MAG: DUF971 domain-containing protein [Rubripirellula sp.]
MNEYSESSRSTSKSTETDITPTSIERDGDRGIVIRWSDGVVSSWSTEKLRAACPCATCREKKRGKGESPVEAGGIPMLPILSAAEARPLQIEAMQPVGSYAYNITFSDGHSSGIYPFVFLHEEPAE